MEHTANNITDQPIIALVNIDAATQVLLKQCHFIGALVFFDTAGELIRQWKKQMLPVTIVLAQVEVRDALRLNIVASLQTRDLPLVPIVLLSALDNKELIVLALRAGITDIFNFPLAKDGLETRINFLTARWVDLQNRHTVKRNKSYATPLGKRAFDVFFAGLALLLLLPLLAIIYVWVKLESKGPAFYYSYRVGTGYKVFKFYKFRSMFTDADKRLKDLKHLNLYESGTPADTGNTNSITLCEDCKKSGKQCQFPIFADDIRWCEKEYSGSRRAKSGSAFFKLKDDPRITRAGKFIRNTSIDELPQLWNVIIGDMSIVGNRPLPLYEAEKLTTDKYALRFLAPAGITGLWQVEKRGKAEMSEDERLELDNTYARNHSFRNDIKLILKTIPALFQKENV